MSDTNEVHGPSSETFHVKPEDSRREFLGKCALLAGGLSVLASDKAVASEPELQESSTQEKHTSANLEKRVSLILARLEAESRAVRGATVLAGDGGYCDFFVENNDGGPFHEKCQSDPFLGVSLTKEKFSPRRMEELKNLRRAASDDYPDFFVEGSGPAWHERIDDFGIREQLGRPEQRAFALRRSNVIQTFTRIAESINQQKR